MGSTGPLAGVLVCCSGIAVEERQRVRELVHELGGGYAADFTERVSVLVTRSVGTAKARAALQCSTPVVRPSWLKACAASALLAPYEAHTPHPLEGLTVTATGLDEREKLQVADKVSRLGGKYTRDLDRQTSFVIAVDAEGQKYEFARQWKIPVVTPAFLDAALELRRLPREKDYCVDEQPVAEKGTRQQLRVAATQGRGNGSMTGSENNTVDESFFARMESARSQEDKPEVLEGLRIYVAPLGSNGGSSGSVVTRGCLRTLRLLGATRSTSLTACDIVLALPGADEAIINGCENALVVEAAWLRRCYEVGERLDPVRFAVGASAALSLSSSRSASRPSLSAGSPARRSRGLYANGSASAIASDNSALTMAGKAVTRSVDSDMQNILGIYGSRPKVPSDTTGASFALGQHRMQPRTNGTGSGAKETQFAQPGEKVFNGARFQYRGLSDCEVARLQSAVSRAGGILVGSAGLPAGRGDGPIYVVVAHGMSRPGKDEVSLDWVEECIIEGNIIPPDSMPLFRPLGFFPPMNDFDGVTVTVSGFGGAERRQLKRLASLLGANVCEALRRRQTSHLITANTSGAKYDKACEWGIPAVVPAWLYACARRGERMGEEDFAASSFTGRDAEARSALHFVARDDPRDGAAEPAHPLRGVHDVLSEGGELHGAVGSRTSRREDAAEARERELTAGTATQFSQRGLGTMRPSPGKRGRKLSQGATRATRSLELTPSQCPPDQYPSMQNNDSARTNSSTRNENGIRAQHQVSEQSARSAGTRKAPLVGLRIAADSTLHDLIRTLGAQVGTPADATHVVTEGGVERRPGVFRVTASWLHACHARGARVSESLHAPLERRGEPSAVLLSGARGAKAEEATNGMRNADEACVPADAESLGPRMAGGRNTDTRSLGERMAHALGGRSRLAGRPFARSLRGAPGLVKADTAFQTPQRGVTASNTSMTGVVSASDAVAKILQRRRVNGSAPSVRNSFGVAPGESPVRSVPLWSTASSTVDRDSSIPDGEDGSPVLPTQSVRIGDGEAAETNARLDELQRLQRRKRHADVLEKEIGALQRSIGRRGGSDALHSEDPKLTTEGDEAGNDLPDNERGSRSTSPHRVLAAEDAQAAREPRSAGAVDLEGNADTFTNSANSPAKELAAPSGDSQGDARALKGTALLLSDSSPDRATSGIWEDSEDGLAARAGIHIVPVNFLERSTGRRGAASAWAAHAESLYAKLKQLPPITHVIVPGDSPCPVRRSKRRRCNPAGGILDSLCTRLPLGCKHAPVAVVPRNARGTPEIPESVMDLSLLRDWSVYMEDYPEDSTLVEAEAVFALLVALGAKFVTSMSKASHIVSLGKNETQSLKSNSKRNITAERMTLSECANAVMKIIDEA